MFAKSKCTTCHRDDYLLSFLFTYSIASYTQEMFVVSNMRHNNNKKIAIFFTSYNRAMIYQGMIHMWSQE